MHSFVHSVTNSTAIVLREQGRDGLTFEDLGKDEVSGEVQPPADSTRSSGL